MEEDILNYSPIVMFRGTPCTSNSKVFLNNKKVLSFYFAAEYICFSLKLGVKSNPGELQGLKDVPVSLQIFFSIF